MYNEAQKKKLSEATIRLLMRCINDVKKDDDNTTSVLLRLNNFVRIVFNQPKRVGTLCALIKSGMWYVFDNEVVK